MKLVNFLFVILLIVISQGCSQEIGYMATRNRFPNAEIESVPGVKYRWIVKDGNNIYFVHYHGAYGNELPENAFVIRMFGRNEVVINPEHQTKQ